MTSPTSPTSPKRAIQPVVTRSLRGGTSPLPALRRTRRFGSLASRLVTVGVGQLVLLALTAIGIFIAEGPHEEADPEDQLTPAAVDQLERLIDSPVALTAALDELHAARVELSLYDEAGQLIASNVDPPLAIPPRRGHRPPPPPGDRRPPGDRSPPPDRPPDLGGPSGERTPGSALRSRSPDEHPARGPNERATPSGGPANARRPGDPDGRPPQPPGDRTTDTADRSGPAAIDPPPFGPGGGPGGGPGFDPGGPPPRDHSFGPHRVVLPLRLHGGRGLLVARGVHGAPPGFTGPLLVLIGGFVILVIGALITARWIVRPIERLSRTARALGSGDLKARSRLDRADEIGELGHRFDEMAERITGLLVTEKELLANVAHELRTPLTRIGVALDLANEGDAEAARASLIEIAVDVSELETIVDDILTAMRFEIAPGKGPAQLPLRRAFIAPAEIVAAAADRMRGRHPARPLEVTTGDDLPAIHVDPILVRRVIDNLLENAHKYTPDLGSPIELDVQREGDGVVFEVRDRGIGIPPEDLPRIFTAFFRGERSRSRETGGVGLGLTLAKRIVEAHDGTIDVTSTLNAGSTIRVTIPA